MSRENPMAKKGHKPIFCPMCNIGRKFSFISPMGVRFIDRGKSGTEQSYPNPHFKYTCPRCQYQEIHDNLITQE